MTDDQKRTYARGYQRGYQRAIALQWPHDLPIPVDHEIWRDFVKVAKALRDAIACELAKVDPEYELARKLEVPIQMFDAAEANARDLVLDRLTEAAKDGD